MGPIVEDKTAPVQCVVRIDTQHFFLYSACSGNTEDPKQVIGKNRVRFPKYIGEHCLKHT